MAKKNNPFSTDSAAVDPEEVTQFETLEDRILSDVKDDPRWSDDNDDYDHKYFSVRIRSWQESLVETIKSETGSNYANIYRDAILQGLPVFDDELGSVARMRYSKMQKGCRHLLMNCPGAYGGGSGMYRYVNFDDLPDPIGTEKCDHYHGEIGEVANCKMIPSQLARIRGDYIQDFSADSWVYRVLISCGLVDSMFAGISDENIGNESKSVGTSAIKGRASDIEKGVNRFINDNAEHWEEEGIDADYFEDMKMLVNAMSDRHSERTMLIVDRIGERAEIIDGKLPGYKRMAELYENDF